MGRSVLKKVAKNVLAYLIIAPMVCCGERPSDGDQSKINAVVLADEAQQLEDSLGRYRICADSLRHSKVEFARYYAFAYETLLNKEHLPSGNTHFHMSTALDLIHIFKLDNDFAIAIDDHDWNPNQRKNLEVYFVDKDCTILADTIFKGSKYDTGSLRIWECKKPLENGVVYSLNWPVSSVWAGSLEQKFYQIDADKKLRESFYFEDIIYDFTPTNTENFDSLSRQCEFISPTQLRVSEKKWWTNNHANEYEGKNEATSLISSKSSVYTWNEKTGRFVR